VPPTATRIEHSRKKAVRGFLGRITSRKNLKKWAYLFGKTGESMEMLGINDELR
jgi:hypothetical protein